MVIFRENTEDVYAGIEFKQGTPECKKVIDFLNNDMLKGTKKKIREDSGIDVYKRQVHNRTPQSTRLTVNSTANGAQAWAS